MIIIFYLLYFVKSNNRKILNYNIIPFRYSLFFDIKSEGFEGFTEINIHIKQSQDFIDLNVQELDIENVTLDDEQNEYKLTYSNISEDVLRVNIGKSLEKNQNYILKFKYKGKYSKQMDGIYKSDYNNTPIYSTHFEATSARKAFPSFDQPDLKAKFILKVKAPEDFIVLSNSSVKEKIGTTYTFNTTKPMSTYLVAFVVGKLDFIQTTSNNNIPIKIYADKEDLFTANFALKVAKEALDFFERYFEIKYPFPKLDLVAIPSFAMGAMENWGLVTFRKSSLLYNNKTDSTGSKLLVADTVSHEIAHMWFGNLVTMKWWNDLWLNEGFATWAATMAIHNLPKNLIDFDVWTNFINQDFEYGMEYDALQVSHPIAVEVNNPNEINQIFDQISYNKGASIIRMLEKYTKHENFRKGIQRYMNAFSYSNATSTDLFKFQDNPNIVINMVNSWINQEGFPLITVKETSDSLELTQSRFLTGNKNDDKKIWIIPLTIQFYGDEPQDYFFNEKTIKVPKKNEIYKINLSNSGVYRVLYSKETFEKILTNLDDVKEKLNIINDLFALGLGGYIDIRWVLKTVMEKINIRNYEILKSILYNLENLCKFYYNDFENLHILKNIIRFFIDKDIDSLELKEEGKTITERLKNGLILHFGVFIEDENTLSKLKKYYENYVKYGGGICPDYTYSMFSSVVDEKFSEIFNIAKTSKITNIKIMALKALGSVKNIDNLNILMNAFNEFERQNLNYFFAGLSSNLVHRKKVVMFFIDNYYKIKEYTNNDSIFNTSMCHILGQISDPELNKIINSFLKKLKNDGGDRTIKRIQEYNKIAYDFRIKVKKIVY